MADGTGDAPRALQMGAKGAYIVRLLMVGDSACGKTSLVLRFDQNVFSTKFVTTIGVDYRDKMVKVCSLWSVWTHVFAFLFRKVMIGPLSRIVDTHGSSGDESFRLKTRRCDYSYGIRPVKNDSGL
jgi:Ras family